VLIALLLPVAARAAEDAPSATPESQTALASPDVARMSAVLDSQVGNARFWYWGWTGFYSGVIVGETVLNATTTGGSRISAQVNIVTSWFGLFSTLVLPPPVAFDWDPVAKMPEGTLEERAAKSAAIRALFEREVTKERFYHSALNHIVGLAVNAGVCAYLYWGLHLGGRALLNLFFGSLVWEANIFTSPNAASRVAAELQGTSGPSLQLLPLALGTSGAGVAVVGRF
jgi:hypothetical protein